MSITQPRGTHSGHGLGSQSSRPGSASRRQHGEKEPDLSTARSFSAPRSARRATGRQRSGGRKATSPSGARRSQRAPQLPGSREEPGGGGRNRRGLGGSTALHPGRSGAGSRAGTGRPRPGGAPERNRRERGGRVLTYAVLLLPFGGHPAGHGAGSRRDARAPLPTPPFSDRGTGKVSPDGGVMWCGRSQPGRARRPSASPPRPGRPRPSGSTQRERSPAPGFIPVCVPGAPGYVPGVAA